MDLKGKKFLVTGGAGFIGSNLVGHLLDEEVAEIVIFDNFMRGRKENISEYLNNPKIKIIEGDLRNSQVIEQAVNSMDGVFHLASVCLAKCQNDPKLAYDTNVTGTFNLLEAATKNNVKRIIFSSSSSVYGNAEYSPMEEKHPFNNKNIYGATKICGEALFKAYCNKYGLPFLSLRYMNVYGPKQDYLGVYVAVIIKIIDCLQNNEPPTLYNDGSQAFDFVYVDDVCRANILAMKSDISDEAYNISSGTQTSVLELCNMIMDIMDKHPEIIFKKVADATLVTDRIGSTNKAEEDLKFNAMITLKEGLEKTIKWKLNRNKFND